MIWYALFMIIGGFWICQGLWLIFSGVWDLLRILFFGYPGDEYGDGEDT